MFLHNYFKFSLISTFIVSAIMTVIGAFKFVKESHKAGDPFLMFGFTLMIIGIIQLLVFSKKNSKTK
jgi:hypothetical protein